VTISSIVLLKVFLNTDSYQEGKILWRVIIHTVFVFSELIFSLTDKVHASKAVTLEQGFPV